MFLWLNDHASPELAATLPSAAEIAEEWAREEPPKFPADPDGRVANGLVACAPDTFAASLDCLEEHLTPEMKVFLLEKGATATHFQLGMFLRNNWGLWNENSVLRRALIDRGFTHADDMSGAILNAYVARLRGEPFDIQSAIRRYRDYWLDREESQESVRCPPSDDLTEREVAAGALELCGGRSAKPQKDEQD
ncbi:MAG: DUF6794 domain-containing protein [Sphingomonadaceae bacterium]